MISRGRLLFILVSLTTVVLVVGGSLKAATARERDDGSDSLYKYLTVFMEVLQLVDRAYVDQTDPTALLAGALEGSADALDPFSLYIPSGEVDAYLDEHDQVLARSGLMVLKERGVAYAVTVAKGSPAEMAGLERGDVLASIDGQSTREHPLWQVERWLAREPGSVLEIERLRLGQREIVELTLGAYPRPAAVLEAHRGVPVLRLEAIDETTVQNVEASLATLRGEGTPLPGLEVPETLVIDLRDVAGGDPQAAYRVAGLFAEGELGVLRAREETLEVFASEQPPRFTGKVAILTNRTTQGAAEILTAVLEQRTDATLVGDRTFGHSGRQSLIPLSNGDRLRLTNAFFTGPDRTPLNEALEPDLRVRPLTFGLGPDEATKDQVLERALAVVLGEEEIGEARRAA